MIHLEWRDITPAIHAFSCLSLEQSLEMSARLAPFPQRHSLLLKYYHFACTEADTARLTAAPAIRPA